MLWVSPDGSTRNEIDYICWCFPALRTDGFIHHNHNKIENYQKAENMSTNTTNDREMNAKEEYTAEQRNKQNDK